MATRWQCYVTTTTRKSGILFLNKMIWQHASVHLWSAALVLRLKPASLGWTLSFWSCSDLPSWLVCTHECDSCSSVWWSFLSVNVFLSPFFFAGLTNHLFGCAVSAPESSPALPQLVFLGKKKPLKIRYKNDRNKWARWWINAPLHLFHRWFFLCHCQWQRQKKIHLTVILMLFKQTRSHKHISLSAQHWISGTSRRASGPPPTCVSCPARPFESFYGCIPLCSFHNASPESHPSGPACMYSPACSSATGSQSELDPPLTRATTTRMNEFMNRV